MNTIKIPWFIYPVLAAFSFAWLITGYISYKHTPTVMEGIRLGGKKSSAVKTADISLITEKNIFSLKTASPSASGQTDTFVTESGETFTAPPPRSIKLIGILFGHGYRSKSYAFMDLDGEKVLLAVGETFSGVKLESLDKTSGTVITSSGRTKLELYSDGSLIPSATASPSAPPAQPSEETGDEAEPGDMTPTEKVTMTRADFINNVGDINNIIKSVLMRPYEKDGQIVGFRLSRMTKDSVLRELGLKNGDAIMRINGEELKSPEVLFSMLSSVENVSAVTLDLERAGQRKTIFVEIN
jgi:general secretion pathway protein C